MLIAPSGLLSKYVARLEFKATNNIAEYECLILGLSKAKAQGAKALLIKTDSQAVAGQVEKEYIAREPELARYLVVIRGLEWRFQGFTLRHIPRSENSEADELVKAAPNNLLMLPKTFLPSPKITSNRNNYKGIFRWCCSQRAKTRGRQ
jgi:ribonuclease HI